MKLYKYKLKKFLIFFLIGLCIKLSIITTPWLVRADGADYRRDDGKNVVANRLYTQENEIDSARRLLTRGKRLYEQGQYQEAIALLERSAQQYQTNGDAQGEALSKLYLANAYQDLGEWQAANQTIETCVRLVTHTENLTQPEWKILARCWNSQGNFQLTSGNALGALETWEKAEQAYRNLDDEIGTMGSQLNQVQALQQLGMYRRGQHILSAVYQTLEQMPPSLIKAIGLRSFGMSLEILGEFDRAQTLLEESLAMFRQLDANNFDGTHTIRANEMSTTFVALGNNARALQQREIAQEYYQRAAATATKLMVKVEAELHELSLSVEMEEWSSAIALAPRIQAHLKTLPHRRFFVDACVNFSSSLLKIPQVRSPMVNPSLNRPMVNLNQMAQLLAEAIDVSINLKDLRAQSYALKQLGYLYEQTQQWSYARQLTQRSIIQAQRIHARDILATAQWQLGRILKQQGNMTAAIAAYTEAFNMLQSLRSDLVATHPELQFSFYDTIDPIYRELVGLLLEATQLAEMESGTLKRDRDQKNLQQAREIIEALQLAELDNFFRNTCVTVRQEQIDRIDPNAAVIYPIILPDRLATIVSLPGQPLRHYQTELSADRVEEVLAHWLKSLNPAFDNSKRLQISEEIYNWLIQPVRADLAASEVDTLVFVLDGSLRNLPMAALYDGTHYLIENYSIALTPGLQLLEPRTLIEQNLQVLSAGLTQGRQGFPPLPAVELEVNQIASQIESKILLDRTFTEINLQSNMDRFPFPIVHLATHGQFSSHAEQTFLLTWDDRINVQELNELLQSNSGQILNPIELLVLSACQTALGDNRAALGLAGVAVRSGARSTLATLWSVTDESTAILITKFYQEIARADLSKAQSLQLAQIQLLNDSRFQHPYYWAPFVLVGNWL